MSKQRVKAFTILEVTITMLIAAVLIGITYTTYSIVFRSYSSFNHQNQEMAMLVRLDQWLKKDFARADSIQKDTAGIILNGAGRHIKYTFDPDFIIRTETKSDTFQLKTETVTASFENLPVTEVSTDQEHNRLDDLVLDIVFRDEKIPYHYHKLYSSANLINRNPDALN